MNLRSITFGLLVCVSAGFVIHRVVRKRGWFFETSVLLLGIFASVAQYHFAHASFLVVATLAGEGAFAGLTGGFILALLVGCIWVSIPREILVHIERAESMLGEAERLDPSTLGSAQILLQKLERSSHSLVVGTGSLRNVVGLFTQGMSSAGWNRIERVRTSLEAVGNRLAFRSMRAGSLAESPEAAELWRSIAIEQRFYAESLNTTLESLAARISFYNLMTALIVSSSALLVTVTLGIIQIYTSRGK